MAHDEPRFIGSSSIGNLSQVDFVEVLVLIFLFHIIVTPFPLLLMLLFPLAGEDPGSAAAPRPSGESPCGRKSAASKFGRPGSQVGLVTLYEASA